MVSEVHTLSTSVLASLEEAAFVLLARLGALFVFRKAAYERPVPMAGSEHIVSFSLMLLFHRIVLLENGFLSKQHFLLERFVLLELLVNSGFLVVARVLPFLVEKHNGFHVFAVVLEQAEHGKRYRQNQDHQRGEDVVVVAEEWRLDHRPVKLDKAGVELLLLPVLVDFATDHHEIVADYVYYFGANACDGRHLDARGLVLPHLEEVGDFHVENGEVAVEGDAGHEADREQENHDSLIVVKIDEKVDECVFWAEDQRGFGGHYEQSPKQSQKGQKLEENLPSECQLGRFESELVFI